MNKDKKEFILNIILGVLFIGILLLMLSSLINLNEQKEWAKEQTAGWEKSYKALDSEATNKYNDYDHTISSLKEKVDEQNTSIVNLTKQIETLKSDNNALRLQIDEYKKEKLLQDEIQSEKAISETTTEANTVSYNAPTSGLTPTSGVNNYNGQLETYYNLPMDGVIAQAQNFGIYGNYWVREDGVKMYGDYVILACNRDVHPMGSLVETSLGTGISLDTGAFASSNPYQVDIAVTW